MKAVVYTQYGPPEVLQLREMEKPTPKDNDVLIRVHATTVAGTEIPMRRGKGLDFRIVIGLRRPRERYRVLGMELAGEIESLGKEVTRFKKGDQVYGFTGFGLGGYAEYCRMPEKGSLAIKPANVTYEEAAAVVDGATTALFFLNKGRIRSGQEVLINGASGSIGAYAVQLAKYFGAHVTGVCSTANLELARSLGADRVIDYTEEDFTASGRTYDIIFDTVGKSSFSRCKGSLKKGGRYLLTVGWGSYLVMLWTSVVGSKKLITGMSLKKTDELVFLRELIEAGRLRPVIDRRFPLEEIVEAHRYVEAGHKKGNVVVTVGQARLEEVRVIVRPETDRDLDGIREVTIVAFQGHPCSQQTEHLIVEALRAADALELSLVAESDGEVVGHIAFSAADIGGSSTGWSLLGPVAVRPDRQGEGIGRALVEAGLDALRSRGACGCVLVGDPAFYGRFGFTQYPGVVWHSVPDENVLCLLMSGEMPTGEVVHHPAFLAGT